MLLSSGHQHPLTRVLNADHSELGERKLIDIAMSIADPLSVVGMDGDDFARSTPPDVELDGVDTRRFAPLS